MGRQTDKKEAPVGTRRRVYAVCEGLTEKTYLKYFSEANRPMGCFEILIYEKETFDQNQSDRMQLVEMMKGEMELRIHCRYTPYTYVSKYIHRCLDSKLNAIEYSKEKMYRSLNKIRVHVAENAGESLDDQGFVKAFATLEDLVKKKVADDPYLSEFIDCFDGELPDLRHPEPSTVSKIDRYFVVFDRDLDLNNPGIRTKNEYRRVFEECRKNGYEVLLSTPMFEFWLLLHHLDIPPGAYPADLSQKDTILEELKFYEEDKCTDWSRKELEEVKGISEKRFSEFYNPDEFKNALTRSNILSVDIDELLEKAGSNVGVKLDSLRNG